MRIVTIGDVGVLDGMVHIGDEAMFHEATVQLRARGALITGVSSNPAETAERYGVDAVPAIGFHPATTGGRLGQRERRARVLSAIDGGAGHLPQDDPAWQVVEAVREADGVLVAGGGNMASLWPMHVYERNTLGLIARRFDKPLVVSGQTIGPVLEGEDRELVTELLDAAALVGLREGASLELVRTLGVDPATAVGTVDDASFLGFDAAPPAGGAADVAGSAGAPAPYLAVSLSAHVGDADRAAFATAVARLLDRVAGEAGLEVVFLAHWASLDPTEERGDSLLHRAVLDRLTVPARVEPTTDSPAAARFARGAALHLTSRYHPAVFAVAGGVPTVGLAVDDYTTIKLTGALGNFGQTSVVTAAQLLAGEADAVALAAWAGRDTVRTAWAERLDGTRAASAAWWDRVAGALRG
ncbi:polysaccharide pyruvyl transferase family protein [Frigoribacterium sp. PhB24]|uniref:polysaccharide pyruvyl transferase family protein n=1 Tax=Frigoribacterium sp. PhB24 TaxID=2485204 RepID=UPI000F47FE0E|nr:polysaccharide pyruvyl transferase family protein [Frigoribacterium sp. PhB24]ROS48098.1 polysaccharide pyruvyl transferase WcaK-like protein [Frigoribacterium sp. PhB24]